MRAQASRFFAYLVVAMVFASIGVVAFGDFFIGSLGVSAALALAMVGRALQPQGRRGWLVVRSKRVDLLTLGVLFVAVTSLALIVPQPS